MLMRLAGMYPKEIFITMKILIHHRAVMWTQKLDVANVKARGGIVNIGELMVVMENGVNIVRKWFRGVYIFAHVVIYARVKVVINS